MTMTSWWPHGLWRAHFPVHFTLNTTGVVSNVKWTWKCTSIVNSQLSACLAAWIRIRTSKFVMDQIVTDSSCTLLTRHTTSVVNIWLFAFAKKIMKLISIPPRCEKRNTFRQWRDVGRVFMFSHCSLFSYSLSNVTVADEKFTLFHQYLRYSHKCGTTVFSIPDAILWA